MEHHHQIFLTEKLNPKISDVHWHLGAKPPSPNPELFYYSLIIAKESYTLCVCWSTCRIMVIAEVKGNILGPLKS